jgi:hypothetical protein
MDYSALRESGMELIRKWASESWTDHNVHDPGITILEACSYAMTELGLRLQLDVADLLRSGASRGAADLEPAHRVLPVGPITPADLRSVLLDHPSISDAQILLPVDTEVPFYELPATNDPPLTYTPGKPRVRPGGLYNVLVELSTRELNSNTYPMTVVSGSQSYDIDLALPFWDDPEAAPFREGAVVNTVAMVPDAGEIWRALPEPHSYFGRADVGFTGPSGAGNIVIWVLLRITTVLAQPDVVVPGILNAAQTGVESIAATAPVVQFAERVRSAVNEVRQLHSYLAGWRNLGEQAVGIGVARVQEIAVRARIEITGGIDVEQLVAGVFADLDQMLSPLVRFESLSDRRRIEPDPDRIYDGPLLRHGFLAADARGAAHPAVLYLSDVLRLIMRRRSATGSDVVTQENPVGRDIVAVTDLALTNFINNRPITSDAENCLHLVEVERYRPRLSVAKSRIVIVRNDSEVSYDLARVEKLLNASLGKAKDSARTEDTSPVWPVLRGELLPVEEYTPLQEDLPAAYGVGHSELPDSAGPRRHAAVRQLQGYLLLFEQVLADVTAQIGNINRFFSADAGEGTTYFTRPLFDVPGVANLLKRFPAGGNWTAFVQDPNNPVSLALHDAAESRTDVLDRRNRMLDHLLARQGEDAVAIGQELHRWAQTQLAPIADVDQQRERIARRRDEANARLIRLKAALLHDAPELNAFRLLASGNPLWGAAALVRIESTAAGFRWHLAPDGQERLRSVVSSVVSSDITFPTSAAASIAAENALVLAGRQALYVVVHVGNGRRRLRLRDGTSAAAQVLAESSLTFASVDAANAALPEIAGAFATLAPLERRVAYLTGIRSQRRRRLLTPTNVHFEIVDDPPGGGLFGKRWRLRELPGNEGQVLLNSPTRFEAPTDPEAIALAEQSIREVLRYGLDEWNYVIVPASGNIFTYELKDSSGTTTIALREAALATRADAEQAMATTIEHLYRNYSAEGFSLVEHLLLRPRRTEPPLGDLFLSLPEGDAAHERDPYSQRISFVFPSGYARNFGDATVRATPVTPDRFRDPELRRHAERVIRQACPAHLRPTVYWVDQTAPGTSASVASFDTWEQRYFDWLDTVLIPGAPAGVVDTARRALVEALNAIAHDAL